MRELDRADAAYGLGAFPLQSRPTKKPRTAWLGVLIVCVVMLAGLFARAVGFNDINEDYDRSKVYPTPAIRDGDGEYAFMQTQPDGSPVTYDSCSRIAVQVNPAGAPDNWKQLVETAVVHTSEATGFEFDIVGTTDSRNFRPLVSTLSLPPPVLVGWSDEAETPGLAGDVAGLGGSVALPVRPGFRRYVTGSVTLDRETFADLASRHARRSEQAIVDHEFGHLVGLAHVSDKHELMYKDNIGQTKYGPGDLEGLARLGNVGC